MPNSHFLRCSVFQVVVPSNCQTQWSEKRYRDEDDPKDRSSGQPEEGVGGFFGLDTLSVVVGRRRGCRRPVPVARGSRFTTLRRSFVFSGFVLRSFSEPLLYQGTQEGVACIHSPSETRSSRKLGCRVNYRNSRLWVLVRLPLYYATLLLVIQLYVQVRTICN